MIGFENTPYFPQDPVDPKYFVGRKEVLTTFKKLFQSIIGGRAANAAIYGERGVGKTSLLIKLKTLPPPGCFLVYCPLSKESDEKDFVDKLLQKVDLDYRESLPLHRAIIDKIKDIPEKVESFSVFELSLSIKKGEMDPYRAMLESLFKLKRRGFKGAYILIDEADLMTTEAIALVRNAIQEIRSVYRFPVGIIAAGKQRLTKRLGGKWSPIARFFALMEYELKALDKKEVFDALTVPHVDWKPDASAFVYERSEGYPTVVQLYGAVCYLRRSSGIITKGLVKESDEEVKEELWQWFENSWKEAPSGLEKRCMVAIAKNNGSATYSQVKKEVKKNPAPYLKRILDKHIVTQSERGLYSLPHKLIAEVILERYK